MTGAAGTLEACPAARAKGQAGRIGIGGQHCTSTPMPPKSLKTPATASTARTRMAQSGIILTCMIVSRGGSGRILARGRRLNRLSTAWYASGDIRLANSASLRLRASARWGGRDVSNRVSAWLELAPCVAQVGESLPAAPSDGRACRALGPPAPPNAPQVGHRRSNREGGKRRLQRTEFSPLQLTVDRAHDVGRGDDALHDHR
jgi:hypothetical protein